MTQTGGHTPDDGKLSSAADYLRRARDANDAGNPVLSMHLFLAAFERSLAEDGVASAEALGGLRQAWSLALESKERALAEYIFEKLESYLTSDEIAQCAEDLQGLALDKLEEFGLSRGDLEEMTAAISQDFMGSGAHIVKLESMITPGKTLESTMTKSTDADSSDAATDDVPAETAQNDERDVLGDAKGGKGGDANEADAVSVEKALSTAAAMFAQAVSDGEADTAEAEMPSGYADLIGYNNAIRMMRDMGIGRADDPEFAELVSLLNRRHGLDRMPALDTILFQAPAREDANYFMMATLGELKLPSVRMHMEENLQGMPVLCVTAQADSQVRLSMLREAFNDGGVLILEDIDLWSAPLTEMSDDANGFFMMQMSRGAREAMRLIRSAVENPQVYVLASCSDESDISGYFLNLLEPLTVVPIDYPTPEERVDIWMDLAQRHPSMRAISRADLVRLSSSMPRFDIYMAAREAMEEAYKLGLMTRNYEPVSRENLFDKLAAYQPLDSDEYRELEDMIVKDFARDLDTLDDLLGES